MPTWDFDSNISTFERYHDIRWYDIWLKFVWATSVLPSLPTKSGTACSIPLLATLTLEATLTDICAPKNICWPKYNATFQRDNNSELFARKPQIAVHIPVHINPFFRHSLVYLTGSDVAILTAQIFWLFSAFASPSNTSRSYGSRVRPSRCGRKRAHIIYWIWCYAYIFYVLCPLYHVDT